MESHLVPSYQPFGDSDKRQWKLEAIILGNDGYCHASSLQPQ